MGFVDCPCPILSRFYLDSTPRGHRLHGNTKVRGLGSSLHKRDPEFNREVPKVPDYGLQHRLAPPLLNNRLLITQCQVRDFMLHPEKGNNQRGMPRNNASPKNRNNSGVRDNHWSSLCKCQNRQLGRGGRFSIAN